MLNIEELEKIINRYHRENAEAEKTSETITRFLDGLKPLVDAVYERDDLNDGERLFLRLALNCQAKISEARLDALKTIKDNASEIACLNVDLGQLRYEAEASQSGQLTK